MTKRELFIELENLLKTHNMQHLIDVNYNSNKATIQNAIDCLHCSDELLDKYFIVFSLKFPNSANVILNAGDWKRHSFNRLYIYNTARMIINS